MVDQAAARATAAVHAVVRAERAAWRQKRKIGALEAGSHEALEVLGQRGSHVLGGWPRVQISEQYRRRAARRLSFDEGEQYVDLLSVLLGSRLTAQGLDPAARHRREVRAKHVEGAG